MGYRVIDALVDHLSGVDQRPLAVPPSRREMEERLREGVPLGGSPFDVVLERALDEIFSAFTPHNHRRFFAMIPCPHDFVSVLADALVAGFNPFGGVWKMAPGAAQVELTTIDWLRGLMGYPEGASGLFVTGGSAATLTALAAAREACLGDDVGSAVGYCSGQTHPSVDRAFRLLGLAPGALRRLAVDRRYRLDLAALRAQLRRDRADGRRPFCVVANAGTTNTAAIDPLPELADLCSAEGLWLHVDGAYGGAARICREGARLLRGLERSDSLTLDPHKWLFQPYELGCVLVRERRHLQHAFRLRSEYFRDIEVNGDEGDEIDFKDHGLQLTRNFRAFKLWMSLQVHGLGAFRAAIERGITLAELAEAEVRRRPGWQIVTPAQLAVVTFRHTPSGVPDHVADAINRELAGELAASGYAAINTTTLAGRVVLRMCTINPRTTEEDVWGTLAVLDALTSQVSLHPRKRRASNNEQR